MARCETFTNFNYFYFIINSILNLATRSSTKRKSHSMSEMADLVFPVEIVHEQLEDGSYAKVIEDKASVYTTAVIEYLVAEVLSSAGEFADQKNKTRH